jgi:1-acyl-sn-glycerol-3-phosphate acyltransferase
MRRILPYFISDLKLCGIQNIPDEGPLLVVSNHPGTYDSIAIAASLPRTDLKIVASGFPILQKLPFASQHLIFVSPDLRARMLAMRSSIRHLQDGGAILIFPSGRVEPDPACLPGAHEAMSAWSSSLELFLKKVPLVKVLPTIVSGVLSPKFLTSPFIRFWRGVQDPQTAAEVVQVVIQMLFPQKVQLAPRISFGVAKTKSELYSLYAEGKDTLNSIVEDARRLLSEHRMWIDNSIKLPNVLYE